MDRFCASDFVPDQYQLTVESMKSKSHGLSKILCWIYRNVERRGFAPRSSIEYAFNVGNTAIKFSYSFQQFF